VLSLLTGGYLAFVAWVTLTPQAYASERIAIIYRVLAALHRRGYLLAIDDVRLEFLANIALFVPVGVFLLLLFGARLWWVALMASLAMTAFIEVAQRSIPGRVPDEQDVLANGLGAVIGAFVALVLTLPATLRRRRRRHAIAAPDAPVRATPDSVGPRYLDRHL
jgi:glycopeptide antibiotics resistance protein